MAEIFKNILDDLLIIYCSMKRIFLKIKSFKYFYSLWGERGWEICKDFRIGYLDDLLIDKFDLFFRDGGGGQ